MLVDVTTLAGWQVIRGVGIALAFPAMNTITMNSVPRHMLGPASGLFNVSRQLGGAFGVAPTVAAFATAGSHASPQAFSQGFDAATGVSALLSLVGAVAGLLLPGARGATRVAPAQAPALTPSASDGA